MIFAIDPNHVFELSKQAQMTEPVNRVAKIEIEGVLRKRLDLFSAWFGDGGSSYSQICDDVKKALDSGCERIEFLFNSPGGAVDGLDDAIAAIKTASNKVETVAIISGMCASAAYVLAAQCSRIVATPLSSVGSIGVIAALEDRTAKNAQDGVRLVVLRSGALKAPGYAGDTITPEQMVAMQSYIDDVFEAMLSVIREGRDFEIPLDGALYAAKQALELGLIDEIETEEDRTMNEEMKATCDSLQARLDESAVLMASAQTEIEALKQANLQLVAELEKQRATIEATETQKREAQARLAIQSWIDKRCVEPDFIGPDGNPNAVGQLAWTNLELFNQVAERINAARVDLPTSALGAVDDADTSEDPIKAISKAALEEARKSDNPAQAYLQALTKYLGGNK